MEHLPQHSEGSPVAPTGTVTFLFTDIEGSTRLLERLKEKYAAVLAEQREILRACFSHWNGHEVDTQGDSFFVAFPRALDALSCVIEAQRQLLAHTWPEQISVRVRMGLHTGEPILGKTGYVGMDVHRAARIASAGYGGQVLLSQTTRDLVYQDLPSGTNLRDLGAHKLKDIRYPQTIFQLEIDGLPGDFPPLKSLATEDEPPTPGEAPYKGLQYFDVADASMFFGRSQMVTRLANAVANERFLALIGASGSGKSSIVRAGLIPALTKGQLGAWQVVIFTPTAHPLEACALALTRSEESVSVAATLQDDLWREPRSIHLYARKNQAQSDEKLLLVVDQFEELFTLCRDSAEKQAFIDALLTAAMTPNGPVHVLINLRADFYEHLAEWANLREAVAASQVYLGAMNAEELRLAIEEPARLGGWEFVPGLVELMLHEVGADEGRQPEPGALPLLSHALLETWKHRRGNLMTLRAYTESGGVRKAIARTAETLYSQELTPPQQRIARNIFLRLTELGEGTQDTRRRAAIQEFYPSSSLTNPNDVEEVLVKLADARLIITGEGTAEVAHEALIREWPTLRDWLAQNRDAVRLHRQLSEAAESWQLLAQDPGALYRGTRLVQALDWAQANPHQLNGQEQAFLDASREDAEREEAEKEAVRQREMKAVQLLADEQEQRADEQSRSAKKFKQLALALGGIAILTVLLAGAALYFSQQATRNGRIAEQESIIARSRELAAAAVAQLDRDPERSILLAMQAIGTTSSAGKPALLEAQDALHRALETSRIEETWRGAGAAINGHAVSSDGRYVATLGMDSRLIVWLYATGEQVLVINTATPPDNFPRFISFSPDGEKIAAPAEDSLARVWEVASGEPLLTLSGHTDLVTVVAYNQPGTLLATASMDSLIKVWSGENGEQLLNLEGHTDRVNTVAFSPDGRLLASAGDDGLIILWDIATGKPETTLVIDDAIHSVAFSPDGAQLAAGHSNTVWSLWDVQTEERLFLAYGHTSLVNQVVFNTSGDQVASAGSDGTARLWEAATGRELLTLTGHTGAVNGVSFSQADQRLITSSFDETVKIWDISPAAGGEWFNLAEHTDRVYAVAYSADGKWIATAGVEGATKLWDAASGELVKTIPAGNDGVWDVSFSPDSALLWFADADTERGGAVTAWDMAKQEPTLQITCDACERIAISPDGNLLATSFGKGDAKIWDAQTGKELLSLTGQIDYIQGLDFSPDGKRLATASQDGTVWIWDVLTGRVLLQLIGEGSRFRVDFSPDGKLLAGTGNDSTATVWDATTGVELYKLEGHTGPTFGVAFSQDGKSLFTSSVDRTIKIWDLAVGSNAQPLTLFGHAAAIYDLAISPDGSRLVTASRDGTSRVYALGIEDLLSIAARRVTRNLTEEECRTFLHLDTCPVDIE